MELKEILETKCQPIETVCAGYKFTIDSERNVYNEIRSKYRKLALEACEKYRQMDAELEDVGDLMNNAPDAFIIAIEDVVKEMLQDIISLDIYDVDKDKIVEKAFEGVYFDEFAEAFGQISSRVEKIITDLNDAEFAREFAKDNRSRWTSATIGGNSINAWSNQFDACMMNLTEGIAYAAVNAIGNAIDRAIAESDLKKVFNNQILREDLIYSVYESSFNLHLLLVQIIKEHNVSANIGTVSEADSVQANAMFNNFTSIELNDEKKEKFITSIFSLDPYKEEYYKGVVAKFGDSDGAFAAFAEYFCIDLAKLKQDLAVEFVDEHIGETEDAAHKCQADLAEYANYLGINPDALTEANEIIAEQLAELDLIYRIVDDIEFETREEADTAKGELREITAIMDTIASADKDPTLAYEEELLKKKAVIDAYTTKIKDKYLARIDANLADFDKKFKTISMLDRASTREEAVRKKSLAIAKKAKFGSVSDVAAMREQLTEYAKARGLEYDMLTEAEAHLAQIEADLRNGIDVNKLTNKRIGILGGKSISDLFGGKK